MLADIICCHSYQFWLLLKFCLLSNAWNCVRQTKFSLFQIIVCIYQLTGKKQRWVRWCDTVGRVVSNKPLLLNVKRGVSYRASVFPVLFQSIKYYFLIQNVMHSVTAVVDAYILLLSLYSGMVLNQKRIQDRR